MAHTKDARFTKGPLRIREQGCETAVNGFHVITNAQEVSVAYVAYRDDAVLFAAAHELFDAIEAAMRIEPLWMPSRDWKEDHEGEADALIQMRDKFEAALLAALGRTPPEEKP